MDRIVEIEDEKIFFRRLKCNYEILGWGSDGEVFDIGNSVIKYFNGIYKVKCPLDRCLQFAEVPSKYFYFVKKIYVYNNGLLAYECNKCPGENNYDYDLFDVRLNQFIKNYNGLEKEIINLSNKGILFDDTYYNCMYSEKKWELLIH